MDVRVVRGGDPVLRQRPFHVIRHNNTQLRVTYRILLGKQESQELETQSDTVRHQEKPTCWFGFTCCHVVRGCFCLIQLKHWLRLCSASHVAHEKVPDTDQIRGPRLLKAAPVQSQRQDPFSQNATLCFVLYLLVHLQKPLEIIEGNLTELRSVNIPAKHSPRRHTVSVSDTTTFGRIEETETIITDKCLSSAGTEKRGGHMAC